MPKYTRPGEVVRADEVPGAVSYWRFDEGEGETAADAKSLATGTLRGARWVPGIRGTALEFDGQSGWFEFGPEVPLRFGDNAPFTVSCWVKPKSRHGPVFNFRGEKDRVIDTATIVGVWAENGKLCSWMRRDGSIFFPNEQFSPDELVPDEWHHVAVVRHRGGTVEVYQDGVLATRQESRESDGAFTLKYGSLGREMFPRHRPGQRDDPTTKHLEGAVDEFAAFGRALTPSEIARLAGR